jgi:hypothetical protein
MSFNQSALRRNDIRQDDVNCVLDKTTLDETAWYRFDQPHDTQISWSRTAEELRFEWTGPEAYLLGTPIFAQNLCHPTKIETRQFYVVPPNFVSSDQISVVRQKLKHFYFVSSDQISVVRHTNDMPVNKKVVFRVNTPFTHGVIFSGVVAEASRRHAPPPHFWPDDVQQWRKISGR